MPVDENEARRIAEETLQRAADDRERPWRLVEFSEGWLISDPSRNPGAPTKVIERSSGRVLAFPSYVPPRRIMEEYPQVIEKGWEERL